MIFGKASGMEPLKVISEIRELLRQKEYNSHQVQFGHNYSKQLQRKVKSRGIEDGYHIVCEFKEYNCLDATLYAMHELLFRHKDLISCNMIRMFLISFSTISIKRVPYSHVVLGVVICKRFGALGLSREKSLTSKPFYCNTLSGLVVEFVKCFRLVGLEVEKVNLGETVKTEHLKVPLNWKKHTIYVSDSLSSYLDSINL
eukprot:NODE_43_length_33755_cov_1.178542.p23 type:complete len:200 gc:universal NODE_43_length_33755_cov_1.178542:31713-31114(-)